MAMLMATNDVDVSVAAAVRGRGHGRSCSCFYSPPFQGLLRCGLVRSGDATINGGEERGRKIVQQRGDGESSFFDFPFYPNLT